MAYFEPSRRSGRWTRLLTLLLLLLTIAMTASAALAQDETDGEPNPPDSELQLEPRIISETRRGDVTTVTIEIPVGADTFTASNRPTTNFSNDSFLRVGFNTAFNGAQRIFLMFNLGNIPSNAHVQDAVLRANVAGFAPNGDAPMGVLARFLTTPWDPTIITWNNFNPQWGAEIGVAPIPAQNGWIEGNITGPVREWVSGQRANNGIMLQGDESPSAGRERIFHAINSQNGLHPRLFVTYQIDTIPPTSVVNPLPQWSLGTFRVTWTGSDNQGGSGIRHFDLDARLNGGAWQRWLSATTATSADFNGVNAGFYEFRVRAVDLAGNIQAFPTTPQANTRVDTVAPNAIVNPLPQFTFGDSFLVTWTGLDPQPGSGIARYDVQFQLNGGAWQSFLMDTTATSGQVTQATPGATYGFRARARDVVGNVQAWSPLAQTQTTISTGNPTARIVPFTIGISKPTNFLVRWEGTAVPGTLISDYDVQYRFNGGNWQSWLGFFNATSAQFQATQGDGIYEFRVRARDSLGRLSEWSNNQGSGIVVDNVAPFVVPRTFIPVMGDNT